MSLKSWTNRHFSFVSRLVKAICTDNLPSAISRLITFQFHANGTKLHILSSETVQLTEAVTEKNQDTIRLKFWWTRTSGPFFFTILPRLLKLLQDAVGDWLSVCNRNDDKGWVKGFWRHRHNQNSIDSFVHSMRMDHKQPDNPISGANWSTWNINSFDRVPLRRIQDLNNHSLLRQGMFSSFDKKKSPRKSDTSYSRDDYQFK